MFIVTNMWHCAAMSLFYNVLFYSWPATEHTNQQMECLLHPMPASAWKYDTAIKEFFVETTTKQTLKLSELRKKTEISDLGAPLWHKYLKRQPPKIR